MLSRDLSVWMWSEARDALERAERLQRRFFAVAASQRAHSWEPPADVLETDDGLHITVALPGVEPRDIEAAFDDDALLVSCERRLPRETQTASIRRLEIPYGRFERRIPLPPGRYALMQRHVENGCLVVRLRKLA